MRWQNPLIKKDDCNCMFCSGNYDSDSHVQTLVHHLEDVEQYTKRLTVLVRTLIAIAGLVGTVVIWL